MSQDNSFYTLIANSGVQFLKLQIELNPNDEVIKALRFFEPYRKKNGIVIRHLEFAEYISDGNVWVSRKGMFEASYLDEDGNRDSNAKFNILEMEVVDPENEGYAINNIDSNITKCKYREKTALEHFENEWIPLPYFEEKADGSNNFGPTNWARIKLVPRDTADIKDFKPRRGSRYYDAIIVFDTKVIYEENIQEYPCMYRDDTEKTFSLCSSKDELLGYVVDEQCSWIDEYLIKLVHGDSTYIDKCLENGGVKDIFKYKAYYVYLMYYLQAKDVFPKVKLFTDKDVEKINVDIVLDIGNSRTCGLLFENSDFTKVKMLELQNYTNPWLTCSDPFDMRLAFRKADFGEMGPAYNTQFTVPSILRVGEEASWLIYNAQNVDDSSIEKVTNYSSPKRYLWDDEQFHKQWEYILLKGEAKNPTATIYLKGVSEQFKNDGSLSSTVDFGITSSFSRKALMTFVFLEILSQAHRQINSHEFRNEHGMAALPRQTGRIIVTCPTAMTRTEQLRLRQCAEDASIALRRFNDDTYENIYDAKNDFAKTEIIPPVRELTFTMENAEDKKHWGYDEATCCQLVFIYAEIAKRYLNNCKEYFDLYGKIRTDLEDYDKKSVTIGSIDVGAGTTDLMICAYKYDDNAKAVLTPVPLFWESFYYAGDDMLHNIIRQVIIEGHIEKEEYRGASGVIYNHLKDIGVADINDKINDFFGENTNRMNSRARKMRNDFNTQISIPIALKFLEMTQKQEKDRTLAFDDFFGIKKPSQDILDYFAQYFGFRFEELQWKFSLDRMNEIIRVTFEPLLKKLSSLLYAYGCDFVLLAGKPASLHCIEELFLKYYPVPPNRLITLNKYRVGRWYPFSDGNGYFEDRKSLVAVGAMIGYMGDIHDSLGNFRLNMEVMRKRFVPTSEYFGNFDRTTRSISEPYISPEINSASVRIDGIPVYIGTKQLDTQSYRARAIYMLKFNDDKIRSYIADRKGITDAERIATEAENYKTNIKKPLTFRFARNYRTDKECLTIESVTDKDRNDLDPLYFKLRIQTLAEPESKSESETENWLDTGIFVLGIRENEQKV
jgi:hypothetical protein